MLAIVLCFPVWCWEYNIQFPSIIILAMCLMHSLCTSFSSGLKLFLWSHSTVDELSEQARRHASGGILFSSTSIHIMTMVAINLSTLFMCSDLSQGGI